MTRNEKGQFEAQRDDLTEHKELYQSYGAWLTDHIDNDRTVTRRKAGAEAWLIWCRKNECDPLAVGESEARAFVRDMVSDDLAETTISSRFASVSKFYHFLLTDADRDTSIEDNPNAGISLSKDYNIDNNSHYVDVVHREGRKDLIAPSHKALKPLFDTPPGGTDFTKIRNELICRLFWQTAMRSDEIVRVRVDNTDLTEREIEVRSAKLDRRKHPELYHRKVFFEPNLDYLMHRYLDKREEADSGDGCPYLLVGDRGSQLEPSTASRIVKDAAHNAGIQEPLVTKSDGSVQQWLYTGHRLRHARITHLCNKTDMDLNFIRMMAGHAQISTTLDYVSADWGEARDAFREATEKTN